MKTETSSMTNEAIAKNLDDLIKAEERVAEAIFNRHWDHYRKAEWRTISEGEKEIWRDLARAAVAALLNSVPMPTKEAL